MSLPQRTAFGLVDNENAHRMAQIVPQCAAALLRIVKAIDVERGQHGMLTGPSMD